MRGHPRVFCLRLAHDMTPLLRHATALTSQREYGHLNQALLKAATELTLGPSRRALGVQGPIPARARLWCLRGPGHALQDSPVAHPIAPAPLDLGGHAEGTGPSVQPVTGWSVQEWADEAAAAGPDERCCSTWLPITRDGAVWGLLQIESTQALSPVRLDKLQDLCSLYANHWSLLRESEIDRHTQVLNRRALDARLQRMMRSIGDPALHTWVAIIDLDHFKHINDQYGHLVGDEVLVKVASLLRQGSRQQDLVFRFGGEEFVVLLDRLDRAGVRAALDRLRRSIAAHRFATVGRLHVSMGAAAVQPGDGALDALRRADSALYRAKRQGRNQVVLFENMLERSSGAEEVRPPGGQPPASWRPGA